MAKVKRHGTIQHTAATPPPVGVPAVAPARPLDADEAETKHAKLTDPHRVGADRAAVLRARVAAAAARHAHKTAHGKLPAAPKPVAKAAAKKKKPAAVKPTAPTESY